jgi:hypothetical protein
VVTSAPTGGAVGVLVPGAPYFVANSAANTFQLRPSPGGPVMVFGSSGGCSVDAAEAVYDAQSLRRAMSGLMYKGRSSTFGAGRFNARWGLLQNSSLTEVSVSGLTVTVNDLNGVIQTSGSSTRGPYLVAIPSSQHVLATAHASLTRVDLLIAEVLDNAADASGDTIPGRTRIIPGTPGLSAPSVPDGTLEVATFSIPPGSGTATPTVIAPWTVAAGGVLPVRTTADLPTSVMREAMYADVADADRLDRYSGSVWNPIASKITYDYVNTMTAGAAVTGWTTYTPTITGAGSATWTTRTGRWIRIAPKTVAWIVYLLVSGAGSGTDVLQVNSPTNPDRTVRQVVDLAVEGATTPSIRGGKVYLFPSGTGATWDRMRWDTGSTSNALVNMGGSDLLVNMTICVQGVYMEA